MMWSANARYWQGFLWGDYSFAGNVGIDGLNEGGFVRVGARKFVGTGKWSRAT
jgi:hypothetical protein